MDVMSDSPCIDVDATDDVATITLRRDASANALDAATVDALVDGIEWTERAGHRVLVLRSSSARFCAGFDLDGAPRGTSADLIERFLRIGLLLERVLTCPALTIAVLEGPAVGAGADLAAACDVRVATADASLRFPGSAFGVVLGTRRLAALIGPAVAARLAATGERVTAGQAHRLGLLDSLVLPAEIDATIHRLAHGAGRRSPATLGAVKSAVLPSDPAGLADLARSLAIQPDLHADMAHFAQQARPTTPREAST